MKRRYFWGLPLALTLLTSTAGSVSAGAMTVTLVPGLTRVGKTGTVTGTNPFTIFSGKAETESFQIVIHAPTATLTNVTVSITDFVGAGTIPKNQFTLYRENFVQLNTPSPGAGNPNAPDTLPGNWFPDALIPFVNPATGQPLVGGALQAQPFALNVTENGPIWADVAVPRTAVTGDYAATITVASDQGSATAVVHLHVWNFALPLAPSLHSLFGVTNPSPAMAQILLQHRLMPLSSDASYDASYAATYGMANVFAWPGFWSGTDNSCGTPAAAPTVAQFQAETARHPNSISLYDFSFDEIAACTGVFSTLKQWARNMHQVGIKNAVSTELVSDLMDDGSGTGRSAVDAWILLPFQYDKDVALVPTVLTKGDEIWSYNTLTQDNYSPKWEIDYAPINFRIQPGFINQSLGVRGLDYWRIDNWVTSDPWSNPYLTLSGAQWAGDGLLVYPGEKVGLPKGSVVPSIRLKQLRKGVDDFEYVQMLRNQGQSVWAMAQLQTIAADWHHWTRDPNQLEAVRELLGAKLEQLTGILSVPAITSAASAIGTVGSSFSYQMTASNSPSSFNATGLPAGLSVTTATGLISGTPTVSGTFSVTLSATNSGGTGTATLTLTVNAAAKPTITAFAANPGAITAGNSSTLSWTVTGATRLSLDQGVGDVTGRTSVTVSPLNNTLYTLTATNSAGSVTGAAMVMVTAAVNGPLNLISINASPNPVTSGQTQLSATLSGGTPPFRYSWAVNPPGPTFNDATLASPLLNFGSATGNFLVIAVIYDATNSLVHSSLNVTVNAGTTPPPPPPPALPVISGFTAAPSTLVSGSSSFLSWTVSGATSLSIDQGIGNVTGRTSVLVSPLANTLYTLTAANSAGAVTSQVLITMTSSAPPPPPPPTGGPTIQVHPTDQSAAVGDPAGFSVFATGTDPLSYQWFVNGAPVYRANSTTYFFRSVTAADNNAKVYVQITDANGGVATSIMATLHVMASAFAGAAALPAPDLSGFNGGTFSTHDTLTLNYGMNAQFNWVFMPVTPAAAGGLAATVESLPRVTSSTRFSFSTFALAPGKYTLFVQATAASSSSAWAEADISLVDETTAKIQVYPNPWRPDKDDGKLHFIGLPPNSTLKIFTVSGRLVRTLTAASSSLAWDLINDAGDKVASGIYLYLLTDGDNQKIHGKFAVTR